MAAWIAASNVHFGKTLANPSADMLFMNWLQSAARDQALDRVEQFHPILQWRVGHRLPLIEPLSAMGESPFAAHTLGIHLQFLAFFGLALPTDFSFWHRN
jgi:hypothetical protein